MPARRAVLLLVLLLLVTACSGAATSDAGDPASDATEAQPAQTSSPSEDAVGATGDPGLDRIVESVEATAEQGTVAFEISIETEGTQGEDGVQPVSAEGTEDFDAEQRTLTFEAPGGQLRAIVDGTDIYVEVPGTEDDTWARVELESLIAGGVGFGGPGGLPFRSATDNLAVLERAVTAISAGDEEDIDGATTTRYDMTVDLALAAEQAAESNATWEALAEQSGLTQLDMQVWLDDSDLIRRIAYSLDLSQAEVEAATEDVEVDVAPQGTVTVLVDYFDYGTPVDIEIPAEDNIVDIDEDEVRDSLTVPEP